MAPMETAALQKSEAGAAPDAQAATGGGWDSFAASPSAPSDEPTQAQAEGARSEARGRWQDFVVQSEADADGKKKGDSVAGVEVAPEQEFVGRADEGALRQGLAAPAPVAIREPEETESLDDNATDRAAVLGEPPSTLSTERAEALKDAVKESERNRSEAKALLESQANRAAAAGEVVRRSVLRSFKVGADGAWYESGYNGEVTTPLARGSDALRELMKKYPEFDWNKLLDRRQRQVFQLDDAWYDLEVAPEQE
jgi:hypothetical protein